MSEIYNYKNISLSLDSVWRPFRYISEVEPDTNFDQRVSSIYLDLQDSGKDTQVRIINDLKSFMGLSQAEQLTVIVNSPEYTEGLSNLPEEIVTILDRNSSPEIKTLKVLSSLCNALIAMESESR